MSLRGFCHRRGIPRPFCLVMEHLDCSFEIVARTFPWFLPVTTLWIYVVYLVCHLDYQKLLPFLCAGFSFFLYPATYLESVHRFPFLSDSSWIQFSQPHLAWNCESSKSTDPSYQPWHMSAAALLSCPTDCQASCLDSQVSFASPVVFHPESWSLGISWTSRWFHRQYTNAANHTFCCFLQFGQSWLWLDCTSHWFVGSVVSFCSVFDKIVFVFRCNRWVHLLSSVSVMVRQMLLRGIWCQ